MDRYPMDAKPKSENIIYEDSAMRLTLLTSRLLRIETGHFTDAATQTVWSRSFDQCEYSLIEGDKILSVVTPDVTFHISKKRKKLIKVIFSNGTEVSDFRRGNLKGTARTLDMANGAIPLQPGLMSRSGVSILDDSHSLLLDEEGNITPRSDCKDLYIFAYGHSYQESLRDFYRLTGPVPLIPKFAFGNWWSRYRAYTQEEYRSLMQTFIHRRIPITVATIDMDWHWTDVVERFGKDARPGNGRHFLENFYNKTMPGWTGYSWNTELFPDHRELLEWLHDHGFAVTLNVHPSQGIRSYENQYEDMCSAMGIDPKGRKQIPFDITDPTFRKGYFEAVHHPLEEEGVDFWWLDWQQGNKTAVAGLDPLWALNHFHTLHSGRANKRPLILSRYAGPGSHRYPLGFSGDTFCTWRSLHFQPYFTNTAANAGYTWWSHDIGGHQYGVQDDELYLRWLQYGVFSPVNRLHSSNSDFMGKEPWKRCWSVRTVAEDFLRLRHRMIPLLYSANYRTHTEGIPLCAPLYYKWDTEEAYEFKNEYLFGSQLLVCPITSPIDKRTKLASVKAWLPNGIWTDIFTGDRYTGGQTVVLHRDLDSIPVLAGEGTILPMYAQADTNDLSLQQPLEIHLWQGNGSFTLYEDDGISQQHQKGIAAYTDFVMTRDGENLTLEITVRDDHLLLPKQRQITLCFRDVTHAQATSNGCALSVQNDSYLKIPLILTSEGAVVTLTGLQAPIRLTPCERKVDLFTRLQGRNSAKNKLFRKPHHQLPRHIREILDEYDAMI